VLPFDALVLLAQAYGGSIGLAVVASALYGRWVQRHEGEQAAAKLDGAEGLGLLYSLGSVMVCFIWLDGAATLRQAIGLVSPFGSASFPVALGVAVAFVVSLGLNVATWYIPLTVARVVAVDTDETVDERLAAFATGSSLTAVLLVLPLAVMFSPPFDVAKALASLVAAQVLWALLAPRHTIATHRTTPPSAAERERLNAAFSDVEFEPQTIRTIALDTNPNGMMLHDIPGRQQVLVSDYFLAVADDEQLRVEATEIDYLSRTWFREGRLAVLLGTLLACVWLLSPLAPASNALVFLLVVLVTVIAGTLLLQLSKTYYRADSATADRVGARRLLEYNEWWLDVSDKQRDHGLFYTLLLSEPPTERRLERLREMADDEPSPTDGGQAAADDPNPAD